ncbi:hypothetical protein ONZ45_g11513 [Pleurotus djamor]|nr:hypothetical protein ONZ45_g11513 [Pleurotus djamor]
MSQTFTGPSPDRESELQLNLKDIRDRISVISTNPSSPPTLVAVSKYKPAEDIVGCYNDGQRDFGENYVQELVEKAKKLPLDIRWHFIGGLQSNKSKQLASLPNLYCLQTLSSIKAANALNNARPIEFDRLNVMIQVNTSGEDAKSGLPPLSSLSAPEALKDSEVYKLASHILTDCPRLSLMGLMTIGSLAESTKEDEVNQDFERLKDTRDALRSVLPPSNTLLLSMGMSSDFEVAIRSGSDIVRVGTGIFGARPKLKE